MGWFNKDGLIMFLFWWKTKPIPLCPWGTNTTKHKSFFLLFVCFFLLLLALVGFHGTKYVSLNAIIPRSRNNQIYNEVKLVVHDVIRLNDTVNFDDYLNSIPLLEDINNFHNLNSLPIRPSIENQNFPLFEFHAWSLTIFCSR